MEPEPFNRSRTVMAARRVLCTSLNQGSVLKSRPTTHNTHGPYRPPARARVEALSVRLHPDPRTLISELRVRPRFSHQNYARSCLHRPQLRPGAARRQWRSAGAQFRDHDGQAGAPAWSTVRHWWCHSGCSGRLGCVASRLGQHMGPAVSLCQFCSINGAYTV